MLWDEIDFRPPDLYALVILTLAGDASTPPPLLADPLLVRAVAREMDACAGDAPGRLWGYIVLPDSLRLVVGPSHEQALDAYIAQVKQRTTERICAVLARRDADTLARVLRYNPVRGGVTCRVWQAGMHRSLFGTEYKLSNALYSLRQRLVAAGLAESGDS